MASTSCDCPALKSLIVYRWIKKKKIYPAFILPSQQSSFFSFWPNTLPFCVRSLKVLQRLFPVPFPLRSGDNEMPKLSLVVFILLGSGSSTWDREDGDNSWSSYNLTKPFLLRNHSWYFSLLALWSYCSKRNSYQSPRLVLQPSHRLYQLPVYILWGSVQFSCSVMSNSLRLHELQHARPPCPSPTPGVYSCPLSQWCHPTSHPLSSPSPPTLSLSQHQGLFQSLN